MRLLIYFILSLAFTAAILWWHLRQTEIAYQTDKSAYAWTGFLPFILPLFYLYGAAAAGLIAVVAEVSILIGKLWK